MSAGLITYGGTLSVSFGCEHHYDVNHKTKRVLLTARVTLCIPIADGGADQPIN